MLFSQIIHWLICAIQLINIDTVSENKIDTSGVVFVLPAADHRSGRFNQWHTSEPDRTDVNTPARKLLLCIATY